MSALYSSHTEDASLFAEADAFYATMKVNLTSPEMEAKTGAEVERQLAADQQELVRRLFQAHLTLRGQGQVQEVIVGADGIARPHRRRGQSRQLETVFGTVDLERTGHAGRNLSTLYPVDASLNAPAAKYSHEVDRQIAKAAARLSFDEALEMVCGQTGAHLPKRQAEEAVQRAARDFDDFYSSTSLEFDGPTSEFLVLTLDQKGVVLHQQDLAEATRQAAKNSRWKMDSRLSPGEKRGRKRMATVAAVYTVAPYERTAQQVIARLRHARDIATKPRPKPEGKRVWATLTRQLKDVIADAFDEACSRDPERQKHWFVLVDGDRKLTRWVRKEARRRQVKITLVLDFIHALEYLWKAAHVFFKNGSPELEAWVLERLERMLEGRASYVAAGMKRMATVRKLTPEEGKPVDKAAAYLLRRSRWGMMRYHQLLSMGAPIATGVIEGACRHLINDRMDRTGARWRLLSAEAVLRVRSLLSSGDFDEYWQFHEQAEAHRNHLSNYADAKVPTVKRPTVSRHLRVVN